MSSSSTTASVSCVNDTLPSRLAAVRALIGQGRAESAVAIARETSHLYPGIAAVALALGEALLAAGHLPTAIAEFQRALRLDPDLADARYGVGCAWLEAGEPDRALDAFAHIDAARAPAGLPEKISAAEAMKKAKRSDPNYVRHLFDQFSADYDARMLGQLGYSAPRILRHLAALVLPRQRDLAVLDLGCGTGLSGAAFRSMASRLDGIDLSPRMIEKAQNRGIYDSLAQADIETALAGGSGEYDLVLAADTLVYLGDLGPAFAGVARSLKPGGHFLFTVEKKKGEGFELGPRRRWRHSQAYLRGLAADNGMDICGLLDCVPRTEAGEPVPGLAAALARTGRIAN